MLKKELLVVFCFVFWFWFLSFSYSSLFVLSSFGYPTTNQFITSHEPCIAFRVDLPDGDYSLVPEGEEGEAEAALQYVEVLEDTDGAQANTADEGKLRCI
jgi:hypothetical protein